MMSRFSIVQTQKQSDLFAALSACGEHIIAIGHPGISANLVGKISVNRYVDEDRLDINEGTHHVHIDWCRLQRCEFGFTGLEGTVTFFDEDTPLFKLFRVEGDYPEVVKKFEGVLL